MPLLSIATILWSNHPSSTNCRTKVVNFVLGLIGIGCHHGFHHGDCAADQSL